MLYLLLAIASSSLISVIMRLTESRLSNQMVMVTVNYAVCFGLSLAYVDWANTGFLGSSPQSSIVIGLIAGVLYLAGFVFMKFNMQENGIVLASIFMKLGVIIPTLMAVVIFGERMEWTRALGILLAVGAIVLIHFEKEEVLPGSGTAARKSSGHRGKIFLILLLLVGGMADSMTNVFEQLGSPDGKDGFLFVTFFTAFVLAVIAAFLSKIRPSVQDLLFGLLIGVPNYFSSRFILKALGSVDAVLVYPMFSVGTLIVVTLAGILFFKEQVSRQKACALALIVAALCLLNV